MSDENTSDELELEYTRGKRKQIIEKIFSTGTPTDMKEQSIVLQALDGLDRISLTRMRIKSEEGVQANSQAAAASILAVLFNSPKIKSVGRTQTPIASIPVLDESLPEVSVIPGELDGVSVKDNYDSFVKRNGLE